VRLLIILMVYHHLYLKESKTAMPASFAVRWIILEFKGSLCAVAANT